MLSRSLMHADTTSDGYARKSTLMVATLTACYRQTFYCPYLITRNLGVIMNQYFCMKAHIGKFMQSCFCSLHQIRAICRSLTFDAAKTIVCRLIHSQFDYYNCLLASLPAFSLDHLQSILNAAARLVCGLCKFDHVILALRDRLHWQLMYDNTNA